MKIDEIKQHIKRNKITYEELSEKSKIPIGTLKSIFSGRTPSPRIDTMNAIVLALNLENEKSIFDYSNISKICTKKIPLLGEIACGKPIFADEDRESYVECGTTIKADFCLTAKGDSMINARIHDGDIIFCISNNIVNNGEIAAVIIENEATLKRVYYYPNQAKLILQAENPAFPPLMYVGEELNQIRIIGKAIAFQSDIK